MRPRIPIAYASLLIIALVAVIGFAAFSPSPSSPKDSSGEPITIDTSSVASARVASAVLALRIADSDTRVATTRTTTETSTTAGEVEPAPPEAAEASVVEEDEPTTEATSPPETAAAATVPRDSTPPPIKVTSHKDGHTVTKKIVTFYGTSEHDAVVTSGPFKAEMAENGDWEMSLVVQDGANGASFTATDEAGNTASVRIVIYYDEPQTTTTTKAASNAATTTKAPSSTPTTTKASTSKWSPNWPADSGGIRNVENWRSTVEKYWPAHRVDCALGIIQRESKGDPRAYNSGSSAEGLLQHLSKYWVGRAKGAGFVDGNGLVATPFNGAANIAAGAYLANYYNNSIGQWWNPWKSGGSFTAFYGSCQSGNPG